MQIKFVKNGITKSVPVGFSWSVFFFGGFPLLLRGQLAAGALLIIACVYTLGFAGMLAAFFANKWSADDLAAKGWIVAEKDVLAAIKHFKIDHSEVYLRREMALRHSSRRFNRGAV